GPYSQAEARITARIDARPFVSRHPVAAPFTFSTLDEQRNLPASLTVAQRVGNVGADGELRESFAIPADTGSRIVYGTLNVEGAVRDDRGRYVASAASAEFVAVDRLVGLRNTRWVYEQDAPADVEYLV